MVVHQKVLPFVRQLFGCRAWNRGFANTLGVRRGEIVGWDGDWLVCHAPIVPTVCDPGAPLRCSAALAIFDEWSTACTIARDPRLRAGASVHLHCMLVGECSVGDVVTVRSRVLRSGSTLAYLDMRMDRKDDGSCVAVGRHIRFLPMGKAWDTLMRSHRADAAWKAARWASSFKSDDPLAPADVKCGNAPSIAELFGAVQEKARGDARIKHARRYANPVGAMHGGAQAIAAELAAASRVREATECAELPRAKSLSVAYLGAVRLGKEVTIDVDSPTLCASTTGRPSASSARIDFVGGGCASTVDVAWEDQ
eukprot:TRINITY_DN20166_c0_g1_i1.p1 TRINITY_DN20166_c0_g1~~TRINITY_DN20166_c0_g1_i1.p1  ORF type:complete len:310 (+),score=62.29 TRINITY_DN20166_c0_g1_i1:95-1024(+)